MLTAKELSNATDEAKIITDQLRATRRSLYDAGLGSSLEDLSKELESAAEAKRAIEKAEKSLNLDLLNKKTGGKGITEADNSKITSESSDGVTIRCNFCGAVPASLRCSRCHMRVVTPATSLDHNPDRPC